jgi:hypothetical protein
MRSDGIIFKTWRIANGMAALIVTLKQNNMTGRLLEALTVSKQGLRDVGRVVQEAKAVWKNNTQI